MKRSFRLTAVADDGEVFDEGYAVRMRLPFDYGWDHWRIYQGSYLVGVFHDFTLAARTCSALNTTAVLQCY